MLYSLSHEQNLYSTASGTTFRAVLNYLEDDVLNVQHVEELAEALSFLRIEEKRSALRQHLTTAYNSQTPEAQLRFTQALRTLGGENSKLPLPPNFREVTPEVLALMLKAGYDCPINLSTLKGFKRAINPNPKLSPELIALLSQFNVVVAGGFPVNEALNLPVVGVSDEDVWVYGQNGEERLATFNSVCEALFKRGGAVAGGKGGSVLVFSLPGYARNIQLILTQATTPEEVVRSFDIDACKAYIVGNQSQNWLSWNVPQTYVLPDTLQAWETNTISKVSVREPLRLEKMKRRGFTIAVPYKVPDEEKFQEYLRRAYLHNPLDTPEQITYLFRKLTGVNQVFFSFEEVKQRFTYRELYDMGAHYDRIGGKIIPSPIRSFNFRARVRELRSRGRLRLFEVQPLDFPPALQELDHELFVKYQCGLVDNDGLSIYAKPAATIQDTVAADWYQVESHYVGVYSIPERSVFRPIIRIASLTPVA